MNISHLTTIATRRGETMEGEEQDEATERRKSSKIRETNLEEEMADEAVD